MGVALKDHPKQDLRKYFFATRPGFHHLWLESAQTPLIGKSSGLQTSKTLFFQKAPGKSYGTCFLCGQIQSLFLLCLPKKHGDNLHAFTKHPDRRDCPMHFYPSRLYPGLALGSPQSGRYVLIRNSSKRHVMKKHV